MVYELDFSDNQIASIDISSNPELRMVIGARNQLTYVNLRNGNITNLSALFTDNPNLTCIMVDDVSFSQNYWGYDGIDSTAVLSIDCL